MAAAFLLLGATGTTTCAPVTALYSLQKGSVVEQGCFGPCLCPARLVGPLQGTMQLQRVPATGPSLYRTFSVRYVAWTYTDAGTPVLVTGSGTYQVGGEVALTQELSLDLVVGTEPVAHYDSGLVPGGSSAVPFPPIDISIHRSDAACSGRLFGIQASPS